MSHKDLMVIHQPGNIFSINIIVDADLTLFVVHGADSVSRKDLKSLIVMLSLHDDMSRTQVIEFVFRKRRNNASVRDNDVIRCELVELCKDVGRYYDRDPVIPAQRYKKLPDINHTHRIKAVYGLVKDQELRIVYKGDRYA